MRGFHTMHDRLQALVTVGLLGATWLVEITGSAALQALWPSGVALVLVFLTRRVIAGLLVGGFSGAILLSGGNPVGAIGLIVEQTLWPAFQSSWKLSALLFTLLLGGFAALIERGGGLETLVTRFLKRGKGDPARRLQGVSMGLGLFCFFDGLANSILLGRVTRTLAERCGVSREKMAYLVDSTSSAVACIAFISTWIAFQLTLIQDGLDLLGETGSPYLLYFASIPRNYYALFTLILLVVVITRDFHIGPMAEREARARRSAGRWQTEEPSNNGRESTPAARALIPLFTLIMAIMGCFLLFYALDQPTADWGNWRTYGMAFSSNYGPEAMVTGTLTGIVAAVFCFPRKILEVHPLPVFLGGVRTLMAPVLILIAAWILGGVLAELGTATLLTGFLEGRLPVQYLGASVFLTGALISFTTGTSWGTMAILMPLALPAVFSLGRDAGLAPADINAQLSLIIAAVFSGAVFGDHCSPFSDTTIVSSIACGVEPHEHVKTQLPFALLAALVAVVAGFIPAGFGVPVWVNLIVGVGILILTPYLFHMIQPGRQSGAGNPVP